MSATTIEQLAAALANGVITVEEFVTAAAVTQATPPKAARVRVQPEAAPKPKARRRSAKPSAKARRASWKATKDAFGALPVRTQRSWMAKVPLVFDEAGDCVTTETQIFNRAAALWSRS